MVFVIGINYGNIWVDKFCDKVRSVIGLMLYYKYVVVYGFEIL